MGNKILFFLGHPAHYHLFKNIIKKLQDKNFKIYILIKEKDILENILINTNIEYINLLPNSNNKRIKNIFSIIFYSFFDLIKKDWKLFRFVKKLKPDILIGTEVSITHIGSITKIPSFILNEDDFQINPEFCLFSYPFASSIISPSVCNVGHWKNKKISYSGYQKLAYLHPNYFRPNIEVVKKIAGTQPFFLFRFVRLTASHDALFGHKGLNFGITANLINKLKKHGRIFITSEKKLNDELEEYWLDINPLDIHHFLFFADFLISDSQSMTVEAAVLGTPSLRINDFVGKISVLEELEHTYGLTYGIKTNETDKIFQKVDEFLSTPNLKQQFQLRRQKMLADKIDVTAFMVWFVENYPKSFHIMKQNPDYQYRFK